MRKMSRKTHPKDDKTAVEQPQQSVTEHNLDALRKVLASFNILMPDGLMSIKPRKKKAKS